MAARRPPLHRRTASNCRPLTDTTGPANGWFLADARRSYRNTDVHNVSAADADIDNDVDLYMVALHEMGHSMFISSERRLRIWDVLYDPTADLG